MLLAELYSRQNEAIIEVRKLKIVFWKFSLMQACSTWMH